MHIVFVTNMASKYVSEKQKTDVLAHLLSGDLWFRVVSTSETLDLFLILWLQ